MPTIYGQPWKVAFLGHLVSKKGVSVGPQKIEAVTN